MSMDERWERESGRGGVEGESQLVDRKSLRKVLGRTANFAELAQDCVCFANGLGGTLLIGIEDGSEAPPADQRIDPDLPDRLRKRVGELTVNVRVQPEMRRHANGGEFIVMTVPRSVGVASTSDGRYFVRIGDTCRPVVGDDVMRLATERPAFSWESMASVEVPLADVDPVAVAKWVGGIRASDRVKDSVKEKANEELLGHYGLARSGSLTNLGVLLLGAPADRSRLGSAPLVQAIKYDEHGDKIAKWVWDDHALSPIELIDAIWETVPDFRESYELPDGMYRKQVPAYDEDVVREMLVNALVHRPYTQRGDTYLNLHPDRLEVVNPGCLPIGVTPHNILHASRRRNEGLARVFHDLGLMEREGSGIDLMYERLLTSGRTVPVVREGVDSVHVTVPRRVLQPGILRLLKEADERYELKQRERTVFALIAQGNGLLAVEIAGMLELDDPKALRPWLGRLLEWGLVVQEGQTKATRYFVPPMLSATGRSATSVSVRRRRPHPLDPVVLDDLKNFPGSSISDIHERVGANTPLRTLRRVLEALVGAGKLEVTGDKRWRIYRPTYL